MTCSSQHMQVPTVWANVLERDCIARINPATGVVVGWIVMQGLKQQQTARTGRESVLNGIAYDPEVERCRSGRPC